jgi:putative membrane protein
MGNFFKDGCMTIHVQTLLIHWAVMVIALWLTSAALKGMSFSGILPLLASALLLCTANIVIRPALALIPLSSATWVLGIVLLVINALLIMLIASLIKGFNLSGILAALLAALIIAIIGMLLEMVLPGSNPSLFHIQQLISIRR